jgi:hypothetical protein
MSLSGIGASPVHEEKKLFFRWLFAAAYSVVNMNIWRENTADLPPIKRPFPPYISDYKINFISW